MTATSAAPDQYSCLVADSFGLPPAGSGPLDGLRFAVKDMVAIQGHTASFGHARWRATHRPAVQTAPLVSRLLAAGAELAGLVKLDQLAFSIIGDVSEGTAPINPLYPERWAGGSSSGTAVAVAGGLADIGIGSDTAGSIRIPAAACGVYSLRPSLGRLDTTGMIVLSASMDVVGLCARQPAVLRSAWQVLAGPAPQPAPIHTVLVPDNMAELTVPSIDRAVQQTMTTLTNLGIAVHPTTEPIFTASEAPHLMAAIHCREIWARHGRWLERNLDYFDSDVRERVQQTADIARVAAQVRGVNEREWRMFRQRYRQSLPAGTALLLPGLPDLMPLRSAAHNELLAFRAATLRLTAASSLTGNPHMIMPVRPDDAGETAVQAVGLVGAADADAALLDLAVKLQPAQPAGL